MRSTALLLCLTGAGALGARMRVGTGVSVNPIRRVVNMMQRMQRQIEEEGERDEKLFEQFMCYCTNGRGEIEAAVSAAEAKVPQVESALKAGQEQQAQLQAELKQHAQDRADAEAALKKSKAIRKKEAAAFAKESADFQANIAAMGQAITALAEGAGSFLQTAGAQVVRRLSVDADLSDADRDMLTNFLSGHQGEYAPASAQISGILQQMQETMRAEAAEAQSAEQEAIASFEAMTAAKKKEIAANTKAIEDKKHREGETGVEVVNMKADLADTKEALAGDQKFLADLNKNCKTAEADYEAVKSTRGEELLALSETIKILNDDSALDLFKKTLPSPSFLQTQVTTQELRRQALRVLSGLRRGARNRDTRLDLITLALRGRKVSMGKVVKMIDDMVSLLQENQKDDDEKKAYCQAELDRSEDEVKGVQQEVSDISKDIKDGKGMIGTLAEEIAATVKGIKDLDAQVAEATKTRKEENAEYKQTMAADNAAKELLKKAKKRLNQFYNPKIALPEVASFVQLAARVRAKDAPPPPPEAVGAYQKKGGESSSVLAMVDALVADLDKEMQELEVEEKDAQAEYEELIKDSGEKRAGDSKSLAEKEEAKADLEAEMEKAAQEKKSKLAEEMAKAKYLSDVHGECDWLLSNYQVRKEARANEAESLRSAKAVLSGADE